MNKFKAMMTVLIIMLCLLTGCSAGQKKAIKVSNDYSKEDIESDYDLGANVYVSKEGKCSTTPLTISTFPRNLGIYDDTDETINYATLDRNYYPNLVYTNECDELCLTLAYMPESIEILRIGSVGKEKLLDYNVYQENNKSFKRGFVYKFAFKFSYEGETSAIYHIKIIYPGDKKLEVAFKLRNGSEKPLTNAMIEINTEMEKRASERLHDFILDCPYTKLIHRSNINSEKIHVEPVAGYEDSEILVLKVCADDDCLFSVYMWKDCIGIISGTISSEPQAFDVDQDGQMEKIMLAKESGNLTTETIYLFDNDEDKPISSTYTGLNVKLIDKQQDKYYKIMYTAPKANDNTSDCEKTGTLVVDRNKDGGRVLHIQKSEDDPYTDMDSYLIKNEN